MTIPNWKTPEVTFPPHEAFSPSMWGAISDFWVEVYQQLSLPTNTLSLVEAQRLVLPLNSNPFHLDGIRQSIKWVNDALHPHETYVEWLHANHTVEQLWGDEARPLPSTTKPEDFHSWSVPLVWGWKHVNNSFLMWIVRGILQPLQMRFETAFESV